MVPPFVTGGDGVSVVSLLHLGLFCSTILNLVISLMDPTACNRRYSSLMTTLFKSQSKTTTPDPLSGFAIIISSRLFNRVSVEVY